MKRLVATLLAAVSLPAAALTPEELFNQVSRSVYVIHTWDGQGKRLALGSGVVIGNEQVITNCHVLRGASSAAISRGNVSYGAELEFPDIERDLCQLKVKELTAPTVRLGESTSLRIGQRVYAVGAPRALELTLTEGIISSLRGDDEQPLIQTSAAISPGSSGGGLFDAEGRLVGITTFQRPDGQQLNFAHPVEWVREVPERGREALAKRKALEEARASAARAAPANGGVATAPYDPSLPKDMPQAGDTWTYVLVDRTYRPKDRSRRFVHTARVVTRGSIVEVMSEQGGAPVEAIFTADPRGIYRARPQILEVAPFATAFRSLNAGEAWRPARIDGLEAVAAKAADETPYEFNNGRIVGLERVTVGAGSFEAIRVELNGRVSNLMLSGSQTARGLVAFRQTVWYAPQVKRAVMTVMELPNQTVAYELESYALR
jgi:serine protease Do